MSRRRRPDSPSLVDHVAVNMEELLQRYEQFSDFEQAKDQLEQQQSEFSQAVLTPLNPQSPPTPSNVSAFMEQWLEEVTRKDPSPKTSTPTADRYDQQVTNTMGSWLEDLTRNEPSPTPAASEPASVSSMVTPPPPPPPESDVSSPWMSEPDESSVMSVSEADEMSPNIQPLSSSDLNAMNVMDNIEYYHTVLKLHQHRPIPSRFQGSLRHLVHHLDVPFAIWSITNHSWEFRHRVYRQLVDIRRFHQQRGQPFPNPFQELLDYLQSLRDYGQAQTYDELDQDNLQLLIDTRDALLAELDHELYYSKRGVARMKSELEKVTRRIQQLRRMVDRRTRSSSPSEDDGDDQIDRSQGGARDGAGGAVGRGRLDSRPPASPDSPLSSATSDTAPAPARKRSRHVNQDSVSKAIKTPLKDGDYQTVAETVTVTTVRKGKRPKVNRSHTSETIPLTDPEAPSTSNGVTASQRKRKSRAPKTKDRRRKRKPSKS